MNGLITTGGALMAQDMFSSFIGYIDRCPKTTRTYTTNLRQFAAWTKYAGIQQPRREDIIAYREWLTGEHSAIELDPSAPAGWKYRNGQAVTCKPNTVKQYLQSVKQFFAWTAAEGIYPNVAANVHAPKVKDTHRKNSLTAAEVIAIEKNITRQAEEQQAAAAANALPRQPLAQC